MDNNVQTQNNNDSNQVKDLIIIGSGPAGLTAAIYAARADLKPLVIAGMVYGGQLMLTSEVENFPGFAKGIMGPELMTNMLEQAKKFGAEVLYKDVTRVEFDTDWSATDSNAPKLPTHKVFVGEVEYKARAVVVATGAKPRKLAIPGETELWGRGVSSCATCDGAFYRDKVVAVIGGGDSAMEEACFLTKFASKVYVVHRREEFRASQIMVNRARQNPKVEFVLNSIPTEILGQENKVSGLKLQNVKTSIESELKLDGVFLAIGYIPETEMFAKYIDINPMGYARPANRTMSKVPGVFIAGDVEDDHYRQAITAAADGCKAALDAEHWLSEQV